VKFVEFVAVFTGHEFHELIRIKFFTAFERLKDPLKMKGGRRPFPAFCALLLTVSILAGSSKSADEHFRRANQLLREGKLAEAESAYLLGLKIDPKAYHAYNNLGMIYFQNGDYRRAAESFRQACLLRPEDPEINFNLGLAFVRSADYERAIPHLRLGAGLKEHAIDAHYLLGIC